MTLSNLLLTALQKTRLMLAMPALLLTACASSSPPCIPVSQPLPAPPLMSTQQPQESYSERAQRNISEWQKQLTSTSLMNGS